MTIYANAQPFADVEVSEIAGEQALGYCQLTFHFKFILHPAPEGDPFVLTDLNGDLRAQVRGGPEYLVGRLIPLYAPVWLKSRPQINKVHESLSVELNHERIEAIEAIRLGGNLNFVINIRGRYLTKSEDIMIEEKIPYLMNQGAWVENLHQLGFARRMLLEVPMPDEKAAPQMAQSVSHLTKANEAMMRGNWREAVGCCRDALEALSVALADDDLNDPKLNALFEGCHSWDKDKRLHAVRRAIKVLAHPARHADEVATKIDWDRTDAYMMVSMIAALLQRFAA